jgi:hypothetical protein
MAGAAVARGGGTKAPTALAWSPQMRIEKYIHKNIYFCEDIATCYMTAGPIYHKSD